MIQEKRSSIKSSMLSGLKCLFWCTVHFELKQENAQESKHTADHVFKFHFPEHLSGKRVLKIYNTSGNLLHLKIQSDAKPDHDSRLELNPLTFLPIGLNSTSLYLTGFDIGTTINTINDDLKIIALPRWSGWLNIALYAVAQHVPLTPSGIKQMLSNSIQVFREGGISLFVERLINLTRTSSANSTRISYQQWMHHERQLFKQYFSQFNNPLSNQTNTVQFSILLPVYNPKLEHLKLCIQSVLDQRYPNWQLCIVNDASTHTDVIDYLRDIDQKHPNIRVLNRELNGHIVAASNDALEMATGDFIALLDHDDCLSPYALQALACELKQNDALDILYSDEDKLDEQGQRTSPHFKSDWNPDLILSHNYICHLLVVRTSLAKQAGGFYPGTEGAQDYDLLLQCAARTDSDKIRHISLILYHWRIHPASTASSSHSKSYTHQAGKRALTRYLQYTKSDAHVEDGPYENCYRVDHPIYQQPTIGIIIPTFNAYSILKQCIDSILSKTQYSNYHLYIVNNRSDDAETLQYLDTIAQHPKVSVLSYPKPFNFSAINNFAVQQIQDDYVLMLNNDTEVINENWLQEMLSLAQQENVGAVGALLLYPDNTIQHAGVILGIGGVAGHAHKYLPADHHGYFTRPQLRQSLSAVTGACLLVQRKKYLEVGGLDEKNLSIAFNDIDFCLKLGEAGYRNIYTPFAKLYHHESKTRGAEDSPEKIVRFNQEALFMKGKWQKYLINDPYYNPHLSMTMENFSFNSSGYS